MSQITPERETSEREVLIPLGIADDPEVVGGKAAGLAAALAHGHRVPDALVIPVGVDIGDDAELVLDGVVERLGGAVAVRSSAVGEDSVDTSYAGQYESILGVTGDAELVAAVRRCRASADSAAVLSYAGHAHDERRSGGVAVLVQRMVDATAAGVAFSIDPVSGHDHVVIEATAGVGDALLAGEVTGERWTVDDTSSLVGEGCGVLTAAQADEVARLCRQLAGEAEGPVDVEWAFEGEVLVLLQVRPVTVVPVEPVVDVPDRQTFVREPRVTHPLNPLSFTSWLPLHGEAFRHTFARFGVPLETIDNRHLHGRVYSRSVMVADRGKDGPVPPAPVMKVILRFLPPIRRRMKAALAWTDDAAIHRLVDDWEREGREWTHRTTRELRERDLGAMADAELADHFDDVQAHILQVAKDHFDLAVGAMYMSMGRLGLFVEDRLGWPVHDVFTLVQGYGTASTAHGDAIRRLVDDLGADGLRRALDDPSTLLDDPAAQEYVEHWGHRVHLDLAQATEAEHPALIAGHLRRHTSAARPEADRSERTAAAEEAADRARSALSSAADRERFDALLSLARRGRPTGDETEGTVLEAITNVRYAALEAGRRFVAAGRLRELGDVFFLERDEIVAMLRSATASLPDIARRRGEHQWAMANPCPDHLGPEPAMPDLGRLVPPRYRDTVGALGWSLVASGIAPAEESGEAQGDVLCGIPGSPGIVEGPVRIIRHTGEFHRVEPGDVVVCAITQASWSPIFDVIGGLVTEQGGPLSHPGTLAREYHLPCVLSARDAMTRLDEGTLVRVDGGAGTVTPID